MADVPCAIHGSAAPFLLCQCLRFPLCSLRCPKRRVCSGPAMLPSCALAPAAWVHRPRPRPLWVPSCGSFSVFARLGLGQGVGGSEVHEVKPPTPSRGCSKNGEKCKRAGVTPTPPRRKPRPQTPGVRTAFPSRHDQPLLMHRGWAHAGVPPAPAGCMRGWRPSGTK